MAKKRQSARTTYNRKFDANAFADSMNGKTEQPTVDPDVKNYRCTKCNVVRKVKGAESNLLELACIGPNCTNNRYQFWKGEVKRLKLLPSEEKLFVAMKGIINVY
jgi:hypothetical protein